MKGKSEKIETSMLSFLIVGLALLVVFSVPMSAASYGTIIEGLNEIGMPDGIPGSIGALTTQPEKIVFGDEDSQSAYYLPGDKPPIVMAREYEDYGRVISIGHEGYFTGSNIDRYDNLQLGLNSIKWLDKDETKKILFDWRSLYWGQDIYQNGLINSLRAEGYTVDVFDGEVEGDVSAEYLANYGIYMICTSWASFTQGEIDAIVEYVQQDGGGLFLTGLGWSWVAYHPESTIDEYPMNVIATNFGMKFFDDIIHDPTNYDGDPSKPIFHLFYEEKELPDLTLSPENIAFSNPTPEIGETVTITATIHNIGEADVEQMFFVSFFDGAPENKDLIGDPVPVYTIEADGTAIAAVSYEKESDATQEIFVVVDSDEHICITESDEGNNVESRVLGVSKILAVPYFNQGHTKWCAMNSIAMVMQYWGERVHSWDLARKLQKPPDKGIDFVFESFCGSADTCVNTLSEGRLRNERCDFFLISLKNFEDAIVKWIKDSKPIIFSFPIIGEGHAVVVCGYSHEEDGDYVFVHDPSGKYWGSGDNDDMFIKVSWDDFKGKCTTVIRTVISPTDDSEQPNPPAIALYFLDNKPMKHPMLYLSSEGGFEWVDESYLELDKGIPYMTNLDLDIFDFDCPSSDCLRYLDDWTINGYQEGLDKNILLCPLYYSATEEPQASYQLVIKNGDKVIDTKILDFSGYNEDNRALYNGYGISIESFEIGEVHLTLEAGGDIIGPINFEIVSPAAPVANSNGPYAGNEGSQISFDASGSYDPDGSIDLYEWDFDSDGVYDVSSASSTAIFTWGDDYTGTVELRVTDNDGLSSTDTATITVSNVAPTAFFYVEQPEEFILPYHSLTFNGAFTDAGWLDTHAATWDFGDDTIVSGTLTPIGTTTAEHTYSEPGAYTVTLRVTDDDGGFGDYAADVTVISAEEATGIIIDQLGSSTVPAEAPKGVSQKIESAIDKLEQVIDFLDQGKYCDAIGKLDGMITQIEGAIDQVNEQRCSVKECKGKECICIADVDANELIERLEHAKQGAIAIRDLISAEHPECA